MRPKTGIRLKKERAVGVKPANRHQRPYVSTSIPTIAQPHTTIPTPLRKSMLPCTGKLHFTAPHSHPARQQLDSLTGAAHMMPFQHPLKMLLALYMACRWHPKK